MGISGFQVAIFDFTEAAHIDTRAALSIEAMLESAQEEVKGVFVSGLSGSAEETLIRLGALQHVPESHITQTRMQAIECATALLKDLENTPPSGA